MAAFDLGRAAHLNASFERGKRALSSLEAESAPGEWAIIAGAGCTGSGFFDTVEYAYVRAAFEYVFARGFFAQWDSRWARYRESSFGLGGPYFSTYLECGYRTRWIEASLGLGLDPVVLDPVTNRYADIGRDEYLRAAIPGDVTRGDAGRMKERLGRQEALLEDLRAVKLEVILSF
jgi:hypothetical protein